MKRTLHRYFITILTLLLCGGLSSAQAALVLDRTRIIYQEGAQSISITLTNKSTLPYVAQSWIEDSEGKKIASPFLALPPLQRVEPGDRNVVRVTLLPDNAIPKDRESVFYLNIREIPPKTDKPNALQIALHSKIKLFYRPTAVIPPRGENNAAKLAITTQGKQLTIKNTTPLHVTLVAIAIGAGKSPLVFEPKMLSPGESIVVPTNHPVNGRIYISHMNDYGGQQDTAYDCSASECSSNDKQRS
ncbi:fimbrial protein [Yersinia entomophaga]|uniref:Fimbrial protein n=1 Tax=Yersinia entomophaga TaxID=935293 RepID=A0ABN4PWB9_YERET|nr:MULTISPECIES: molecular chaperone [Yersinia]ANI29819.1 fimbrial protein [Yersinia entomophaga]OWF86694.1 fimbrial protein [Yersinia entomophaga]